MLSRLTVLFLLVILPGILYAQDSSTLRITELPSKYLEQVSSKTSKYYSSITDKTERTLEKLAKWEAKIKTILEKTSPETAQRLFGNNQLTFTAVLQKYKEGKTAADNYKGKYEEYRDKLTTTVKYLDDKKQQLDNNVLKPLAKAKASTDKLNEQLKNTEAVQDFIKERKKQLMQQALQVIGKSKYLQKINKESYYYIETLRNFRETFSDPKKTEELAMKLLQKVPGFDDFVRRNSMLASLFRMPGNTNDPNYQASLAGLQTRAQVNGLIQQQIERAGANGMQQFQQSMQAAQSQLNELKNKILKGGGGSSDAAMPEGFKPNEQRAKSFWKRFELGTNMQTVRANSFFPVTSDVAMSVGYKPNSKSIFGIGASYKIGLGRGWDKIKITNEGIGLRSFIDWKIKGSFWLSGGFEMNYRTTFNDFEQLKNLDGWQQSGLIGISKSVPVKSKFFKKTKVMMFWDFLSSQQIPKTQPIIFRVGYNF